MCSRADLSSWKKREKAFVPFSTSMLEESANRERAAGHSKGLSKLRRLRNIFSFLTVASAFPLVKGQ